MADQLASFSYVAVLAPVLVVSVALIVVLGPNVGRVQVGSWGLGFALGVVAVARAAVRIGRGVRRRNAARHESDARRPAEVAGRRSSRHRDS
jgi:alpha-D-ribose 1-methylphosphonate 5-triphosphate synthase subunit PhnG